MKQSKNFRAILSVILMITMLVSASVVGFASVSAADGLTLTYSYKYENAGYAEGVVELTAGSPADYGKYYIYWADDEKALDGYSEIATLELSGDTRRVFFGGFTAIPAGATKLIAVKGETTPDIKTVSSAAAVYDIPKSKQFGYLSSDREYTFQALSDIHIQNDKSFWKFSKDHWANALEVADRRGADFITVCGDAVNGYEDNLVKDWTDYLQILADSDYTGPVFETNGNHEMKSNSSATANLNLYKTYTGLGIDTEPLGEEPYYEITINDDHYIFLVLELSGSPNESSEFTKEQLDWFEGLLEKYYGDGNKIIVNQHALFRGYGAGDNKELPFYGGALVDTFDEVKRLQQIMEKYPDIIMLSGHSHIDFKYNYNIDNMDGTSCYTVHIPSTSNTTHPNIGGGLIYEPMLEESSQGYFVDVYDKAVILNGTDLVKNEIMPLYTYMVDYSGEALSEVAVYAEPEELYKKVTVTVDAGVVCDNPAGVKLYLNDTVDGDLTSVVNMTKNDDGTYSAEVSTLYKNMWFVVNNGRENIWHPVSSKVDNCKVTLGGIKVRVSLADIKTTTGASCTNWTEVYVYVWEKATEEKSFEWPGTAMIKEADGTYTAFVPYNPKLDMIIFNNNNNAQTDDLKIDPYIAEVEEGSYTVVEQPTSSEHVSTTAPTSTPVSSTVPTSTPVSSTVTTSDITIDPKPFVPDYGDVNLDEKVNVSDATTIQKHVADIITLLKESLDVADVDGDSKVTVKDATTIQKKIAGLIANFPVESKKDLAEVGATKSELATLLSEAKNTLAEEEVYASYVAYANLKKAYYEYKGISISYMSSETVNVAFDSISTALENFKAMKEANTKDESGAYTILGDFNGWSIDNAERMTKEGDFYVVTYDLPAGTYGFKFYNIDEGEWYGNANGSSFNDTMEGWTFRIGGGEETNCKLIATGGTYKFKYKLVNDNGELKNRIWVEKL